MSDLAKLVPQLRAQGKLFLKVKVTPKSARSEVAGWLADGTLKVRIQAAPERGKANVELCRLLARELGVPQESVRIVSGEASPLKRIRIQL